MIQIDWGKKKKKTRTIQDMRAVYVGIEVSLPRHVTRHVAPCDRLHFHSQVLSLSSAIDILAIVSFPFLDWPCVKTIINQWLIIVFDSSQKSFLPANKERMSGLVVFLIFRFPPPAASASVGVVGWIGDDIARARSLNHWPHPLKKSFDLQVQSVRSNCFHGQNWLRERASTVIRSRYWLTALLFINSPVSLHWSWSQNKK